LTAPTLQALAAARKRHGQWAGAWWTPGAQGRTARTELATRALAAHWEQTLAALTPCPAAGALALAAVGSAGRGDMGPFSDLDLVVVHDGSPTQDTLAELARALWYPIWDAGFDLDHSVRSLAQCRRVAATDIPAAVGLLSLRYVAGDKDLAQAAASAVLADWRAQSRRRLGELQDAIDARGHAFGELAYRLEPDLKEARGGLRDAVTLDALAASWLVDRPHGELDAHVEHVLDVRDALHAAAGRLTNRLTLADQDATAARMGADTSGLAPADALLAGLANAGRAIDYATTHPLRRALSTAARRGQSRPVFVRGRRTGPRLNPLAQGLAELAGEVVLIPGAPGQEPPGTADPLTVLRAARVAAQTKLPLEALTVQLLRACPPLPNPWPAQALQELQALLATGQHQVPVWEALDQAGLVVRLFPQWAAVRNLVQRNPLHRHTVDRHMIETVATLAQIDTGRARRDIVALACLFHDLGKRPTERDHAKAGAGIVGKLLPQLGVPGADAAQIVRLVAHHLLLAELATTRDPTDAATIDELITAVDGRPDLLDGLAALTEADARAAGPKAWTPWRARLVHVLVVQTQKALITSKGV
jgi:[protein-PII] uridylyltransferase